MSERQRGAVDVLDRYAAILAEHGVRPFAREPWVNPRTGEVEPRVLGEPLPLRWRVAVDEMERLIAAAEATYGWSGVAMLAGEQRVAGWPVIVDANLPSGTVLLEVDR